MSAVLAVLAHPDDETIGCGSTLAKHATSGDVVSVMTFTDGVSSRLPRGRNDVASVRRMRTDRHKEFRNALEALGVCEFCAGYFPPSSGMVTKWLRDDGSGWITLHAGDGEQDWDQELDVAPVRVLSNYVVMALSWTKPDIVYTHWPGDLNQDHRRVAEAVLIATRPVIGSTARRVLACEIPESTSQAFGLGRSFQPNVFISLSDECEKRKREALACYASERRDYPHPRSDQAIVDRMRMWGGVAGVASAEAFSLLREVVR